MRSVLLLVVLLGGCGLADEPAQNGSRPTEGVTAPATGGDDSMQTDAEAITGTLGGDAQLEGGCAWVDTGDTRWEVQWPQGYEVSFDPLTLTGPGVTAGEGDRLTVLGSHEPDAMTICQVGPLWVAEFVRAE